MTRDEALSYLNNLRGQTDPAGGKKFMVGVVPCGSEVKVHVADSSGAYVATGPTVEAAVENLLKDDASWPQK